MAASTVLEPTNDELPEFVAMAAAAEANRLAAAAPLPPAVVVTEEPLLL